MMKYIIIGFLAMFISSAALAELTIPVINNSGNDLAIIYDSSSPDCAKFVGQKDKSGAPLPSPVSIGSNNQSPPVYLIFGGGNCVQQNYSMTFQVRPAFVSYFARLEGTVVLSCSFTTGCSIQSSNFPIVFVDKINNKTYKSCVRFDSPKGAIVGTLVFYSENCN